MKRLDMESKPAIKTSDNNPYGPYGLRIRFFNKELFLPIEKLGGAQFVETRSRDFIIDTIEDEWGFQAEYEATIEGDEHPSRGPVKIVRIRVPSSTCEHPESMAKLEALIGYTHDEKSHRKARFAGHSLTPFDPYAIQIEYFEPGMNQLSSDFGFKHSYSGHLVFGDGRGTYSIYVQFPAGYFRPDDSEGISRPYRTGNWNLKSLGDWVRHVKFIESPSTAITFPKSTIPTIYATVPYREKPLGKIQPERLPVVGGEFPLVFVEGKDGKPAAFDHQEVVCYETQQGEEIEVLWAEIQCHDQTITPRFLHVSYEAIEFLIDQAVGFKGDSDSLKAVFYHGDGQTIRYFMKLQVWTS